MEESDSAKDDFVDPLRATDATLNVSTIDMDHEATDLEANSSVDISAQLKVKKEWDFFKKILTQRFPVSKTTQISLVGGTYIHRRYVYISSF